MKKLNKGYIISFIIGAILFGTTGVYAGTMLARDITYDNTTSQLKDSNNQNVDNVQDAIDALYTKASTTYDEYNGATTYTPNTSTQTIPTNNKLLKSNITINPIPSSYKNLSSNTTVNPSNLLSGETAYNNLGQLITGNISTNCVSSAYNKPANSQWSINLGFVPTSYMLFFEQSAGNDFVVIYDGNKNIISRINYSNSTISTPWNYSYLDGTIIKSSIDTNGTGYKNAYEIHYMACR